MRARDLPYFAPRFIALAHRGGWAAGPQVENSVAAFAAAVNLGYRYLETDVHTSADGVLFAFHDDRLDRVTDATGPIAQLPATVIKAARIGGREPIPTLDQLLETFRDSRFNIDIKADAAVAPLAAAITNHQAQHRVCVGSFSTRRLRAFRQVVGPDVATSVSPAGVALYAFGRGPLPKSRGLAFQVPVREERYGLPIVTPRFVRAAHAAGRVVHVWTINDPAEMHRLIDLGVDGLVSDDLVTLRDVCQARGLWEGP